MRLLSHFNFKQLRAMERPDTVQALILWVMLRPTTKRIMMSNHGVSRMVAARGARSISCVSSSAIASEFRPGTHSDVSSGHRVLYFHLGFISVFLWSHAYITSIPKLGKVCTPHCSSEVLPLLFDHCVITIPGILFFLVV